MIYEVHGDVCRLGYLKLVACLNADKTPRSPDYLASLLFESSRQAYYDLKEDVLGLLKGDVNAHNYVKLAGELGFYDRKTGGIGDIGAVYMSLKSSAALRKHVTGEQTACLSEILTLSPVEKLLFLYTLIQKDYHMIVAILRWVFEKKEFTRLEAMQYVMEEIYPTVLRQSLKKASDDMKQLILNELEEATRLKEIRLSYSSGAEWVKSRYYAKYRHTVPPRLEWLVDVGVLMRTGRGRYVVTAEALRLKTDYEVLFERSREKGEQTLFSYLAPSLLHTRNPTKQAEVQSMVEAYKTLQETVGRVGLETLCLAGAFKLLEDGYRSSPQAMSRVFSYLSLLHPDRIFATYSEDGYAEVSGLDLALIE